MTGWNGSASRRARAQHAPAVASGQALCCRCGRPIMPGSRWHADHWPVSREAGGTATAPAHERCNTRAGGRRGAQITNSRRRTRVAANDRGIRGV